jgi:hypothetical protein
VGEGCNKVVRDEANVKNEVVQTRFSCYWQHGPGMGSSKVSQSAEKRTHPNILSKNLPNLVIILTYSLDFLIDTGKGARQNISIFEFEPYNATYVVVTFSLTHKGNFTIVLPIKSNVLSQKFLTARENV